MVRAFFSFLLSWGLIFAIYQWLRHSTSSEKTSVLKGAFISLLTAAIGFGTVALVVAMF